MTTKPFIPGQWLITPKGEARLDALANVWESPGLDPEARLLLQLTIHENRNKPQELTPVEARTLAAMVRRGYLVPDNRPVREVIGEIDNLRARKILTTYRRIAQGEQVHEEDLDRAVSLAIEALGETGYSRYKEARLLRKASTYQEKVLALDRAVALEHDYGSGLLSEDTDEGEEAEARYHESPARFRRQRWLEPMKVLDRLAVKTRDVGFLGGERGINRGR